MPIALALGGGAALGWAHIGVLRVLEEHKIKVGAVAGTSMGALAALCFAADRLDVFEGIATHFTRWRIVSYLDLHFGGGAMLGGRRITRELVEHFGDLQLEDLPIPIAIVAADIANVAEVRLTRGPALAAVQGSIALPGLFRPVEMDARILIDGGVVAQVPLGAARAIAPDMPLVGVDLVGSYAGVRTAPATVRGAMRAAFLTTMVNQVAQGIALTPPDVLIRPNVRHLTPAHFHHGRELIDLGREAALAALPAIKAALTA